MGKYILEIGLVGGEEHLCNSCFLLEMTKGNSLLRKESPMYCRADGAIDKNSVIIQYEFKDKRNYYYRPKNCPLIPVDEWQSEKQTKE